MPGPRHQVNRTVKGCWYWSSASLLNTSEGQCADNWRGIALLAISTLLYERGNFSEAIEKLQRAENLKQSSLGVRVTAMEAIVGLHLQSGEDFKCVTLLEVVLDLEWGPFSFRRS